MYSEYSKHTTEADLDKTKTTIAPFRQTLNKHVLSLERGQTTALQINLGFLCNQECRHCHLSAGPGRRENMNLKTANLIIDYAKENCFEIVDITGGAPELNNNLVSIIKKLSAFIPRIMVRSNLSALNDGKRDHLFELFKDHRVVIVASFPSLNERQAESQRGQGIFNVSIDALKKLNSHGYGKKGTDLELNLVSNPSGAFLPSSQTESQKRFRQVLMKKWGIFFNNLFTFANVPLGRFREWLLQSGNLENYIKKLASSFNPCAVKEVMCRTMLSISWDGYLYDCDFNLARGLYLGGQKIHVSQMHGPPKPGSPVVVSDHCYTCTAGAGFT